MTTFDKLISRMRTVGASGAADRLASIPPGVGADGVSRRRAYVINALQFHLRSALGPTYQAAAEEYLHSLES